MNKILEKLCDGVHLNKDEINSFFSKLMSGNIDASLASSILIALKIKKPSDDEVFHASQFLLDSIDTNESDLRLIDLCGTGGDSKSIINVSTISSLILSALNVKVAKHGNRSVSSKVGSADLFEAIGIDFDKNLDESFESIDKRNISFLFAPYFHKSMKNVIDIRKTLSTRTIFNILGPLINPLRPKCQLLGVYEKDLLETIGKVLIKQGVESGMVVHSLDGMDEISICDKTHIFEFNNGEYPKTHGTVIRGPTVVLPKAQGFLQNIDILKNNSSQGAVSAPVDVDNLVRQIPLLQQTPNGWVASFGTEVLKVLGGGNTYQIITNENGIELSLIHI